MYANASSAYHHYSYVYFSEARVQVVNFLQPMHLMPPLMDWKSVQAYTQRAFYIAQ